MISKNFPVHIEYIGQGQELRFYNADVIDVHIEKLDNLLRQWMDVVNRPHTFKRAYGFKDATYCAVCTAAGGTTEKSAHFGECPVQEIERLTKEYLSND